MATFFTHFCLFVVSYIVAPVFFCCSLSLSLALSLARSSTTFLSFYSMTWHCRDNEMQKRRGGGEKKERQKRLVFFSRQRYKRPYWKQYTHTHENLMKNRSALKKTETKCQAEKKYWKLYVSQRHRIPWHMLNLFSSHFVQIRLFAAVLVDLYAYLHCMCLVGG